MSRNRMRRIAVAAAAVVVVAVGGTAALAAGSGSSGPSAFLDSVAQHLGISSQKLQDAVKAAAIDQVDAQLKAGAITQAQADALKQRIESSDGLPLGGLGLGRGLGGPGLHGPGDHGGPGGHLDAAASYLGLTTSELLTKLQSGKTLADVAKAQGKTVAGLKQALLASEKKELDAAVSAGTLTQAQADAMLQRASARFDAMIAGTMPQRGDGHGWFGPPGQMGGGGSGQPSSGASSTGTATF